MESGTEEVLRKLEELHRHTAKTVAGQIDPHDIEACEALLESYFMQASVAPALRYWSQAVLTPAASLSAAAISKIGDVDTAGQEDW